MKHGESWTSVYFIVFINQIYLYRFASEYWPRKKKQKRNQNKTNKSVWWIFNEHYFRCGESLLNCFEKRLTAGEFWPNDFEEKVNKKVKLEELRLKMSIDVCVNPLILLVYHLEQTQLSWLSYNTATSCL